MLYNVLYEANLSSLYVLTVLTNIMVCAYYSIVGHDIMINHANAVSQGCSRVSCPDNGLRILARIIARDLVTKQRDTTTMMDDRKVSDPQISEE